MAEPQHSIETQLTSFPSTTRHFLWNDDYIELLAHKLDLQKVRTLVDIGSGFGFIAGLFGLYMKPGSQVYGFNPDAKLIADAQARAEANPFSVSFRYEVVAPERLPLEDAQADLVICQYVLSKVADPDAVLKEMVRVVRPGGRVVAFEPNMMIQSLVLDTASRHYTLEERVMQVRYQAFYETGKALLGHGEEAIGDRVPELFLANGLNVLDVRLSDKAAAVYPPYAGEEQRVRLEELTTWQDRFTAHEGFIRACFLKGGGNEREFEQFRAWELAENARLREQIAQGRFVHPGGMLTYIVIGQRPD
ncbi:MAG TPA: methyltransferase domain-containing protein [Oscillatoriaceae cyanobacterium]